MEAFKAQKKTKAARRTATKDNNTISAKSETSVVRRSVRTRSNVKNTVEITHDNLVNWLKVGKLPESKAASNPATTGITTVHSASNTRVITAF